MISIDIILIIKYLNYRDHNGGLMISHISKGKMIKN